MKTNIIINKNLAHIIVKYLDLQYLSNENIESKKYLQFYDNIENIVDISWTSYGVTKDGYGKEWEITPEEEPAMDELFDFLCEFRLDSYQIKEIENICIEDHRTSDSFDYYGSYEDISSKKLSWDDLIEALNEMLHNENEETINLNNLIEENAAIVPFLTIERYKQLDLFKKLSNNKTEKQSIKNKQKI